MLLTDKILDHIMAMIIFCKQDLIRLIILLKSKSDTAHNPQLEFEPDSLLHVASFLTIKQAGKCLHILNWHN